MTKTEFYEKVAKMNNIIIHKAVTWERVGSFQPPLSRNYDRGIATLADGRKVEFAWGLDCGNLSMESVKAIHALQPEREFVQLGTVGDLSHVFGQRNNYAPVLLESEKR